jgi:hypothetical protein
MRINHAEDQDHPNRRISSHHPSLFGASWYILLGHFGEVEPWRSAAQSTTVRNGVTC